VKPTRRVEACALAILAAISLVMPVIEVAVTGGIEDFGKWALAQNLLCLPPIFWWYHTDKAEKGYRAGPLMNAGVIALTVVALPVYLVRTRGWKRGALSIAKGTAIFGALILLGMLGEWLGRAIMPSP
jgi:riboflavin transporter FmnP